MSHHKWNRLKELSTDGLSAVFSRVFLVRCAVCFAQETQYERADGTTLETGAKRCERKLESWR